MNESTSSSCFSWSKDRLQLSVEENSLFRHVFKQENMTNKFTKLWLWIFCSHDDTLRFYRELTSDDEVARITGNQGGVAFFKWLKCVWSFLMLKRKNVSSRHPAQQYSKALISQQTFWNNFTLDGMKSTCHLQFRFCWHLGKNKFAFCLQSWHPW